ncbi:serine hydrolase-domain-containing protein [Pseudomassariella vexata]|uniref:Serine hydrolase-domain-containing protein n=1 Tax=Pseudomassariella vexata TaxID=1141098 RepID=A0A1Y2D634_9PEZI|nr:serine hydrolase-domain-containing protein [Pseudomassariella vexata]ORY54741.1 serine hydrolase-domain-containing protein [Pseudomassariella vexata]
MLEHPQWSWSRCDYQLFTPPNSSALTHQFSPTAQTSQLSVSIAYMRLRHYSFNSRPLFINIYPIFQFRKSSCLMSATAQPSSKEPAKDQKAKNSTKGNGAGNGKKELKILMLHGYTQSGPLFRSKTGALSKNLNKALSPSPFNLAPMLIYPTAPHRLRPADIPGYQPPEGQDLDPDLETDNWGWFRRDEATGRYLGFAEGMRRVAESVREAGGIDGVIGFSQGGAMGALVAAALEPGRVLPKEGGSDGDAVVKTEEEGWVQDLREANGGKRLQFCVVYSGFYARDEHLHWMYEGKIQTPSLHFLGGLDTVVEESSSTGLVERCEGAVAVTHPGGHYVPVNKEWIGVLVGFLRQVLGAKVEEAEL